MGLTSDVISSLISGGVGLFTSGIGAGSTAVLNAKNRRWQEKMYKMQVADNRENTRLANERQDMLIAQQNDYNSPSSQMQRYLAAGINPFNASLDTGNLESSTSPTPVSSAGVGTPQQFNPFSEAASGASSFTNSLLNTLEALKSSQDYGFNNDTMLNRIFASNEFYKAQGYEAANNSAYQLLIGQDMDKKAASTVSNWLTNRVMNQLNIKSLDLSNQEKQKTLDWYDRLSQASFEKMVADAGLSRAQKHQVEKNIEFYEDYIKSVIEYNNAGAASSYASANYSNAMANSTNVMLPYLVDESKSRAGLNRAQSYNIYELTPFQTNESLSRTTLNDTNSYFMRKMLPYQQRESKSRVELNRWLKFNQGAQGFRHVFNIPLDIIGTLSGSAGSLFKGPIPTIGFR